MTVWVIGAVLERDGQLRLRRCYTTESVNHDITAGHPDGSMEVVLFGDHDEELARGVLTKDAGTDPPPGPRRFRVRGTVPMPEDARRAVFYDDGRVIEDVAIDPIPSVSIEVKHQSKRGWFAAIDTSTGGEDAWMAVNVLLEGRPAHSVYIGPPQRQVELDLTSVYGDEAHVGVLYSTGTTAAAAVSEAFSLERRPAPAAIVEPAPGSNVTPWDIIDASVGLTAPVPGSQEILEGTCWFVDGDEAGQGRLVAIGPLKPGRHVLTAEVPAGPHSDSCQAEVRLRVSNPQAASSA